MKVLQVVADGAPGGGTNHVMQLLRGMRNVDCGLVTQNGSYLFQQASKLGIPVIGGEFFRSRLDRKAVSTIKSAIGNFSPDLVHCHGGRAAFFRSFISSAIPTVYTVHGFHYARKALMQKFVGWAAEYWSIRRTGRILFVCDHDKQLADDSYLMPSDKQYKVVYNGIKALQPRPKTKDYGIGFVGRFVYQKHPELFVKMMEQLPGMRAVMVGGGDLDDVVRDEIKNRGLADRITLLGSLDHESALEVLSQLDMLVMTPRWEGLPLLPLESMFMNVPVVSTATGGIPEVITHRETGLLSQNEDADELAALVKELSSDDELRNSIITNANRIAHERFSQEAMLAQIEQCYEELHA